MIALVQRLGRENKVGDFISSTSHRALVSKTWPMQPITPYCITLSRVASPTKQPNEHNFFFNSIFIKNNLSFWLTEDNIACLGIIFTNRWGCPLLQERNIVIKYNEDHMGNIKDISVAAMWKQIACAEILHGTYTRFTWYRTMG